MEGIADSMAEPSSGKEGWIKGLTLCFAEAESGSGEVLLGLQTARSILRDRLDIQILVPRDGLRKDLTFEK